MNERPNPALRVDEQEEGVLFRMNMFAEARGEHDTGGRLESEAMAAVGWVVVNRARKQRKTVKEVILAKLQFSWTRPSDVNYNLVLRAPAVDAISWERADTVADLIEAGRLPDLTDGATHYYNPKVADPPWGQRDPRWVTKCWFGNHVFGIAA